MFFHVYSVFVDVSFLNGVHISAVDRKMCSDGLLYLEMIGVLSCYLGGGMSVSACSFEGLATPNFLVLFHQKQIPDAPEMAFDFV